MLLFYARQLIEGHYFHLIHIIRCPHSSTLSIVNNQSTDVAMETGPCLTHTKKKKKAPLLFLFVMHISWRGCLKLCYLDPVEYIAFLENFGHLGSLRKGSLVGWVFYSNPFPDSNYTSLLSTTIVLGSNSNFGVNPMKCNIEFTILHHIIENSNLWPVFGPCWPS